MMKIEITNEDFDKKYFNFIDENGNVLFPQMVSDVDGDGKVYDKYCRVAYNGNDILDNFSIVRGAYFKSGGYGYFDLDDKDFFYRGERDTSYAHYKAPLYTNSANDVERRWSVPSVRMHEKDDTGRHIHRFIVEQDSVLYGKEFSGIFPLSPEYCFVRTKNSTSENVYTNILKHDIRTDEVSFVYENDFLDMSIYGESRDLKAYWIQEDENKSNIFLYSSGNMGKTKFLFNESRNDIKNVSYFMSTTGLDSKHIPYYIIEYKNGECSLFNSLSNEFSLGVNLTKIYGVDDPVYGEIVRSCEKINVALVEDEEGFNFIYMPDVVKGLEYKKCVLFRKSFQGICNKSKDSDEFANWEPVLSGSFKALPVYRMENRKRNCYYVTDMIDKMNHTLKLLNSSPVQDIYEWEPYESEMPCVKNGFDAIITSSGRVEYN